MLELQVVGDAGQRAEHVRHMAQVAADATAITLYPAPGPSRFSPADGGLMLADLLFGL